MLSEPHSFLGDRLDRDNYEAVMQSSWEPSLALAEPALFASKWFDYRAEHPARSTYRFAHIFTEEVRRYVRERLDPSVVVWHPIKAGDPLVPPAYGGDKQRKRWQIKLNALVRARQAADAWCIPYPLFLRTGVTEVYSSLYAKIEQHFRSKLMHPMFLNVEFIQDRIREAWIGAIEAEAQVATHRRYLVVNHDMHPDAHEHVQWLLDQIARRGSPAHLVRRLISEGWLTAAIVASRFGDKKTQSWVGKIAA